MVNLKWFNSETSLRIILKSSGQRLTHKVGSTLRYLLWNDSLAEVDSWALSLLTHLWCGNDDLLGLSLHLGWHLGHHRDLPTPASVEVFFGVPATTTTAAHAAITAATTAAHAAHAATATATASTITAVLAAATTATPDEQAYNEDQEEHTSHHNASHLSNAEDYSTLAWPLLLLIVLRTASSPTLSLIGLEPPSTTVTGTFISQGPLIPWGIGRSVTDAHRQDSGHQVSGHCEVVL